MGKSPGIFSNHISEPFWSPRRKSQAFVQFGANLKQFESDSDMPGVLERDAILQLKFYNKSEMYYLYGEMSLFQAKQDWPQWTSCQ